jgi:FlaA1/EpsC-like NDP-sugar epimerase
MKKYKNLINRNLYLLIFGDYIIIIISFYVSVLFRFEFNVPTMYEPSHISPYLVILPIVKMLCFKIFAIYRGMWRYTSVWDMINILKANSLATSLIVLGFYFGAGLDDFSRSLFVIDFIMCNIFISFSRLGIRMFFSHIRHFLSPNNYVLKKKFIILIGAGDTAESIIRQAREEKTSQIVIIGILDDDIKKMGRKIHNVQIFGPIKMLKDISISYDEIFICIPSATSYEMKIIIDECKKTNKPFKTLPSIFELLDKQVSISQFRDVSMLDLLGRDEVQLDKSLISNFIKGKRVLITGAGGSIGSELVKQCLKFDPKTLIMIDISELNLFEIDRYIKKEKLNTICKAVLLDVRESSRLQTIFEKFKPQVVFHAAAYKHVPIQEIYPWEAVKTNIYGTLNLCELSQHNNVESFVFVSTDKAVKPLNVMGASKRIAELIIKNFDEKSKATQFMTVRFGNVLSSSGSVIPIFQDQIKSGGPITITHPDMERYFMSIPEASQLILQTGSIGLGGNIYILDMGKPVKIVDLANDLIRLSGLRPSIDIAINYTGIREGEKISEELSLPSENIDKTKHDKIFVLNDIKTLSRADADILKVIDNFKNKLISNDKDKVKKALSKILPEYKPLKIEKDTDIVYLR